MKRVSILLLLSMLFPVLTQGQTIVVGRVVGANGQPVSLAHVHLKMSPMQRVPIASVACNRDGRFSVHVPASGIYSLELTGVDHQAHSIPLIAITRDTIALDVRLAANNLPMQPDEVLIIGDFNKWSFREPRLMTRRKDGTFAYTVRASADTVAYQLVFAIGTGENAMMRSVNGTHAHHHTYDGGGDYHSIVRSSRKKSVTITFDPRRSARSDSSALVAYRDPASMQARYHAMTIARGHRLERYYVAMKERMASGDETLELPHDADAEIADALRSIDHETDPILRGVAMVHYFAMKSPTHDSALALRALQEIAPTSPLWQIEPSALPVATRTAGNDRYFDSVLDTHPSEALRAELMYDRLITAHYRDDTANARIWFDRLQSTFPASDLAVNTKRSYNPDRLVRKGAAVPEFSLASIDGDRVINRSSLAGRYTLIDFWATWCSACELERETLHKAYDKYGGDGFDILSVSFDVAPEQVAKFRTTKWAMPWLNGFVENGFRSALAEAFEVQTIPKPLLVDPSGTIVAVEAELRGPRLERTLSKFLGDREIGNR